MELALTSLLFNGLAWKHTAVKVNFTLNLNELKG